MVRLIRAVRAIGIVIVFLGAPAALAQTAKHKASPKPVRAVAAATRQAPQASGQPQATPNGNPADWFPADAYPPEAKAAGIQGRTAFSIAVDSRGRITGCNITTSSGSPLLDSTTCNLLVTNAHFTAARDTAGQPVAGVWNSAMVWKLTTADPGLPEGIADQGGVSPADAYNQSLTEEAHAAAGNSDDDHSQQQQAPDPGGGY